STRNWTPATPMLSVAVADSATAAPDTVVPAAGEDIATAGATMSPLLTVTVIGALVVVFVAPSRATAVSPWAPGAAVVEFHTTEYGATVSSAPRAAPSSLNCTPATPTLSEAAADTVTELPETVAFDAGAEMETVGATASATVIVAAALVAVLPAASRA